MNFSKFFVDTTPIDPTFYDELGLATEGLLTGGSARDSGDQATADFPDSDFDAPFTLGMGNPYAPFDGPFFSHDPLLIQPSWNTDGPSNSGNSVSIIVRIDRYARLNEVVQGLPDSSSSTGAGDAASGSAESQSAENTERRFAVNITNGQETVGEQIPQPVSCSSTGISACKVEILMNSSSEESINTSTAPSSRAGKSVKRRGGAASSPSHEAKTVIKATQATQTKAKKTRSSASKSATQSTKRVKYPCIHKGCLETFYDKPTMHRHVLTVHMNIRPPCPGCRKDFSRDDSLKRHLDTRPTDSHCRTAAKDDGWVDVGNTGKMRMSTRAYRMRIKLIVAEYGTS